MSYKEDFLFWHMIQILTSKYNYSLVTMSEDQKEVWIENNKEKKYPIIRFMRYDFDWANVLKKDLQRTALNGENIRKQLVKKEAEIFNIYVSQFKPVDDHEPMIKSAIKHQKTTITSVIVDSLSWQEELARIEEQLGKSLMMADIPEEVEEHQVQEMKARVLAEAVNKRKEEQKVFNFGKPILTKVFLAIQIIVFLLMEIAGSSESTVTLVEFGAKYNPYILQGEWWRFITPIFLHIGFLHLALNSMALFYLGSSVERIYGSVRFFFIYLFAGFAGVVASFVFTDTLSAGASGAIFGCLGALLYFGISNKQLFFRTMGMNIIVLLVVNLAFGFIMPGIDNAGHIGGLIGGFLAAAAFGLPKNRKWLYQLAAAAVLIAGSAAMILYGFKDQADRNHDLMLSSLAQEYMESEENEKAETVLMKAISVNADSPNAYFLLGNLKIDQEDYEKAQEYYLQTIESSPQFHQAHYNLALTYLQLGEIEKAKEQVDLAIEIAPSESSYQDLKIEIANWLKEH
ncbi:MAG: rhomboid family intramembrane serine protease [Bacillus sp. (in: firmicutes)]